MRVAQSQSKISSLSHFSISPAIFRPLVCHGLICLVTSFGFAQTVIKKEYYDFDKKFIKRSFYQNTKTKVLDGKFSANYLSGGVQSLGGYSSGQQNGVWTYFFENGRRKAEGYYSQGKKGGLWRFYFENGEMSQEVCYHNNIKAGEVKFYYENGSLKSEGEVKDGHFNGYWHYYHEDATLKASVIYKAGRGIYKEVFADGTLKAKGLIIDGKSDSTWTYYFPSGQIEAIGKEKAGVKYGPWKYFFENGQLMSEGAYKDGKENGQWTYFHPNGTQSSKGLLVEGKKDGRWNLFYENGKFLGEGDFDNGDGHYREYYDDGKLKVEGNIKNSLHVGEWLFFYETGEKEGVCNYGANGDGDYTGYYPDGSKKISGKLKNGQKTGVWRIYTKTGDLAGLHKTYFDKETPILPKDLSPFKVDSLRAKTIRIPDKPSITLPTKRPKWFAKKINELQGPIVGANPFAIIFFSLPVSVEYYWDRRLGYEAFAGISRNPFFTNQNNALQKVSSAVYSRGYYMGVRQKLYFDSRKFGAIYFAQELRYSYDSFRSYDIHNAELGTGSLLANSFAIQHRFEASLLAGRRLFVDYRQHGTISIDMFAGLGVGYRAPYQISTTKVHIRNSLNRITVPPRIGVSFGYFF